MTNNQSSKGKVFLIFVGIIVFLIFLINFALTYLANLFINTTILPQFNDNKGTLALSAHVRLLPSIKLSINNLEYKKENKTIIKINELSAKIAFWQLFSKKLKVTKLSLSDGVINLYNIPPIKWKKSTKSTETEEKGQEESNEIEKNPPKATQEAKQQESFFELDAIELTNFQINYSASETNTPIYIKAIQYDKPKANSQEYVFTLLGDWLNQPITTALTLNWFPGNPILETNINFAGNALFFTVQLINNRFQLQTNITIKNPDIIEQAFSIPKMQLPTQINSTINLENHKLSISPIQIVFPEAVLHATISLAGKAPIIIQMILPEELLTKLSGTTIYQECPLPQTIRMLLKGINTEVTISPPESSRPEMDQGKKTLIKINGLGIQFEGNILPEVLQKNMQTCFDYKLPDESSETTYSID